MIKKKYLLCTLLEIGADDVSELGGRVALLHGRTDKRAAQS
jgi:hypothetical protein